MKNFARKLLITTAVLLAGTTFFPAATAVLVRDSSPIIYAQDEDEEDLAPDNSCESQDAEAVWIICPVLRMIDGALNFLDQQIQLQLTVPNDYFQGDAGAAIQGAWGRMRNIAYTILIPIMLVMVIGTALGFEFISAYTIKRALPRLVIAVVFIAVSYQLLQFLVTLSNEVGQGVIGLITSSIAGDAEITLQGLFSPDGGDDALFGIALAAGGLVAIGALPMIFMYGIVVLMGVLIAYLVFTIRKALIILMIILAPLAVLSWIFPGNDKLWKLWWGTFWKMLAVFPLTAGLIGLSQLFASIMLSTRGGAGSPGFVETGGAVLVIAFGYAAGPLAVQRLSGAFGVLTGSISQRGKGMTGWMKGVGRNATKRRMMGAVRGENDLLPGPGRKLGRGIGSLYRRGYLTGTGQLGMGVGAFTRSGRQRYREKRRELVRQSSKGALENDAGYIAGADDHMRVASTAKSKRDFVKKMRARGMSKSEALEAAAAVETAFKAPIGSASSRAAARRAHTVSSSNAAAGPGATSEDRKAMMGEVLEPIAQAVASGEISLDDATNLLGDAKERPEFSGAGWQDKKDLIAEAVSGVKAGRSGAGIITTGSMNKFHDRVLETTHKGQLASANYRTLDAMAGRITERLNEAHQEASVAQVAVNSTRVDLERAESSGDSAAIEAARNTHEAAVAGHRQAARTVKQQYASLSGLHAVVSQVNEYNGRSLADGVYNQTAPGTDHTIMEEIKNFEMAEDREYMQTKDVFMRGARGDATAEEEARERSGRPTPGVGGTPGPVGGTPPVTG